MKKYIAIFLFVLIPTFTSAATIDEVRISLLRQALQLCLQQLVILQQELAQIQFQSGIITTQAPTTVSIQPQQTVPQIINNSITPTPITMPTVNKTSGQSAGASAPAQKEIEHFTAPVMSLVDGSKPETVKAGNTRIQIAMINISAAPEDLIFYGPKPSAIFTGEPVKDTNFNIQYTYNTQAVWEYGDTVTIPKGKSGVVSVFITVPVTPGDLSFDLSGWKFAGAESGDVYTLTGDAVGTIKVTQ